MIGVVGSASWPEPEYSKSRVDKAGRAIAKADEHAMVRLDARSVVNNWRSSHRFPLNTMQMTLRKYATSVDPSALVWQRLKRFSSVKEKLRRKRGMALSRMQDVGGCRAVVDDVEDVWSIHKAYQASSIRHELEDEDDYITSPPYTGYRSLHLIYRYKATSPAKACYDGMRIEIQLRSQMQHAWATAVETVDIFNGDTLKAGTGDPEWTQFFRVAAAAFAFVEGTAAIPETPRSITTIRSELRRLNRRLEAYQRLRAYRNAVEVSQQLPPHTRHILMELSADRRSLEITGYTAREADLAAEEYAEREASLGGPGQRDVVLVEGSEVSSLPKAYPNYFGDTDLFLGILDTALDPHI